LTIKLTQHVSAPYGTESRRTFPQSSCNPCGLVHRCVHAREFSLWGAHSRMDKFAFPHCAT